MLKYFSTQCIVFDLQTLLYGVRMWYDMQHRLSDGQDSWWSCGIWCKDLATRPIHNFIWTLPAGSVIVKKEKSCIFVKIWIIWIYALQISLPFNLAPKIVFLMRKWNLVVGKLVAWETKWLIPTYLLTKIKEPRKTSFQTGNSLFVEFQSLLKTPSKVSCRVLLGPSSCFLLQSAYS